jgi:uncharacterized lipoprotein YddW (UPF0748 family)
MKARQKPVIMNTFHLPKTTIGLGRWVIPSAVLLLLASLSVNLGVAAETGATSELIDDCRYASDTDARAVWRPMDRSVPVSVSVSALADRKALRLHCNFFGTKTERASWDRAAALDLAACRGLEFQLRCDDASPVSYFSLYLQSGEGWYHATFYPESSNDWNTVTLDKSAFGTEGKPAGWGKIRTIRVSAWRGEDRDTEFFIRDLRLSGLLGRDAHVALIRADSVVQTQPAEARNVAQFTETTAQMLQRAGVGCAIISDADLSADRLRSAKVVVLPYNPRLPIGAVPILKRYAEGGGRLLAFYHVPEPLRRTFGVQGGQHVAAPRPGYFAMIRPRADLLAGAPAQVAQRSWNIQAVRPVAGVSQVLAEWLDDKGGATGQPALVGSREALVMTHVLLQDDSEKKSRLLLAMVGYLAPELWKQAARESLDRVGAIGKAKDFAEATALLETLTTNNVRAHEALVSARTLRDNARELFDRGQFPAAMDQAGATKQRLTEAWCLAQTARPGEFRAFWCHSAFGVEDFSWDEAVRRLADNGFTAILPNMLWGGAAFYESKVLPISPEVAKRGDQIALCLAAAHKYGLQVHVWKVNWNLGHAAPAAFVETLRHAGRLQANVRGQEEPWLCPSNPENQKLEIESMLEVARNYDVDGLHFDYIRYPDSDHCFCAGCRERFQRVAKTSLPNWPRDVLAEGPLRQQWLDWRRTNITLVVRAVSEQAHAFKPNLKISAAVFTNWATDRDGVGQDWKLWCDRGWVDFVCPMDYTSSPGQFESMVGRQLGWAGRTPCYPGIGESASSSRLGVDGVIEQINVTRRHNTGGFVIFNYGVNEAAELVPMLGLGITARQ